MWGDRHKIKRAIENMRSDSGLAREDHLNTNQSESESAFPDLEIDDTMIESSQTMTKDAEILRQMNLTAWILENVCSAGTPHSINVANVSITYVSCSVP